MIPFARAEVSMLFRSKLVARVGLSLAPMGLAILLTTAGSLASGCSGGGGPSPSSAQAVSSYDDACMAALGTPQQTSACAGSQLPFIADAQLKFTVAYLSGQTQCAATDVATATTCYPSSQQALLSSLRSTEDPMLYPISDDFGANSDGDDGGTSFPDDASPE
jgi:hypothetical protein